jgi:hypothetical protein
MNPIRYIRRAAAVLAGLTVAVLAWGAAPAFALIEPLPADRGSVGGAGAQPVPVVTHVVVVGGTPGWQIALIAVGAALLAALAAVLADRTLTARRRTMTAAA